MPDQHYPYFDTVIFGLTAAQQSTLFVAATGTDAAHAPQYTNSRAAGAMPPTESFTINGIKVIPQGALTAADAITAFQESYLEVRVVDISRIIVPLKMCVSLAGFGGHFTQAAASNQNNIGVLGDGLRLEIPIFIDKGASFKVIVTQGLALSAANQRFWVVLDGILGLP